MKYPAVVDLVCAQCLKPFARDRRLMHYDRPNATLFCSPQCANIAQRTIPSRICKVCGKEFRAQSHGHAARGAKFCGRECYAIFRTRTPYQCSKCGIVKTPADFSRSNTIKRGHNQVCRACVSLNNRKCHGYPNVREQHFQHGAKRRGFKWDLTHEQFMSFWQKPCFYCAGPIVTIGLDRLDSKQGYTIENVRPCCPLCNRMKAALPFASFLQHCRNIVDKWA